MNNEIEKPRVQADNNSIAIGEININGTVTGNIHIGHTIIQAADARLRRDLSILLKNVETTWIKGVLEKSVHEAALLELGMEIRAEAVDNPWRMVIEKPDQSQEVIPQGRKIKDIFDEANRLLLILGEPGSGKTTTLLQLARDLIAEVDEAFTQPIPVILNLSTWTNKQQPLDEWLIAELNSKYRLPKKDGKRWLSDHRILPLLDGLDEVKVENGATCVEKINQLVEDYGLQGLVVCSRIKDYTDLNVRLAFYRAIYIQPLATEQVDEYLDRAGDKLASLRASLQADEALKSMAQSPLILNIMSLAYQNTSAEALSDPALNTNEARRRHLFDTFVTRMFNRKVGARLYADEETKRHLSWLARNMQHQNQVVFLIEGLQPSWLPARGSQWLYILASRLIFGLTLGLVWGLVFEAHIGWVLALSLGPAVGFIDVLRFEWLHKRMRVRKSPTFWWSITNVVVVMLSIGLLGGLINWQIFGDTGNLAPGLFIGLLGGLIFGPRGSRQSPENDIQTVEALYWSWRNALKGGLIGGLLGGLIVWLIGEQGTGLFMELLGGVLGAIFKGLNSKIIETKSVANQGIRLSIRNTIFGGLLVGVLVWLIIALSFWLSEGTLVGLSIWLSLALSFGLIGALSYGGFDIIQHYMLRLILVIQGHTPANYARFLDFAADRIFLQKVGGGYRFIHRLLLEHFAEMDTTTKKV